MTSTSDQPSAAAGDRQDPDLEELRAMAEASEQEPPATFRAETPAPVLPGEGTVWVRCRAYRVHRDHHRRDPETGAWRCFLCQPQAVDR